MCFCYGQNCSRINVKWYMDFQLLWLETFAFLRHLYKAISTQRQYLMKNRDIPLLAFRKCTEFNEPNYTTVLLAGVDPNC